MGANQPVVLLIIQIIIFMAQDKLLFLFHPTVASGFEEWYQHLNVETLPEGAKFSLGYLPTLPNDATILGTEFTLPIPKEASSTTSLISVVLSPTMLLGS